MAKVMSDVANPSLADHGKKRILWADRDMPVLDGLTMLRRFRDLAPQLKVILASGVDSDTKAPAPADCECDAYLPKPYSADELLRAVDTVLHLPARP